MLKKKTKADQVENRLQEKEDTATENLQLSQEEYDSMIKRLCHPAERTLEFLIKLERLIEVLKERNEIEKEKNELLKGSSEEDED